MESKQTTKDVMALWTDAMTSHNAGNHVKSLDQYGKIEEKSGRILYNMGCANMKLNQCSDAIKCFTLSVEKDPHSAVAFFQRGVLNIGEKRLGEAMSDFRKAQQLFRGNTFINYKQLGMRCKLHICEVLYNMALIHILEGNETTAEELLIECRHEIEYKHKQQVLAAHEYLQGRYTRPELLKPMTVSADLTFSPPKDVIDNLNKKSVLGKAKVVCSTNIEDSDPSFNGLKRVEELKTAALQKTPLQPKSPLTTARMFFKNPGAKRDRSKSMAFLGQTVGMKGSQSMADIRERSKSVGLISSSLPKGLFANLRKKTSSSLDIRGSKSEKQRSRHSWEIPGIKTDRKVSMGSIFGNTLSPINTFLSNSFDILTAIAVPVGETASGRGFSPIGLDHEHISSVSDDSIDSNDDDVTSVFLDSSDVGNTLMEEPHIGSLETKSVDLEVKYCILTSEEIKATHSGSESDTKSDETEMKSKAYDNETLNNTDEVPMRVSPRRRKIPPPPSYPPPPLPPNIVIMV